MPTATAHRLFLLLLAWAWAPCSMASAVEAPSVAVLPLQKAAASTAYDGLGRALAGMVVSDLSALPGVRLVERDQLDALLAEIALADTGFVDVKTAQKLGSGVGARFVVVGAFTVVDPTFALDARIVEVGTGEIVKAADAHGTVADFVAVEKELVEALVAGLDLTLTSAERRKLMMQAPTEQFAAFSAYSEGVARERAGDVEQAKAAFARALAADPQFAAAHAALGALEAALRAQTSAREDAVRSARDAVLARFLAATPDPRTRPASFVYDQDAIARVALRFAILEEQQRDCDRYAEMRAYIERARWSTAAPRGPRDEGVLGYAIGKIAGDEGLEGVQGPFPPHVDGHLSVRAGVVFRDAPHFVVDGFDRWDEETHGMLSSLLRCYPPERALLELDDLLAAVVRGGVDKEPLASNVSLSVGDAVRFAWLCLSATSQGASDALGQRTEALLAPYRGGPLEAASLRLVEPVVDLARAWEDHRWRRRGLAPDEVVRRMQLLADGKVAGGPLCANALHRRPSAAGWVRRYAELSGVARERHVDDAFAEWAVPSDLGCFDGVAPRFTGPAAAWAYLDDARARANPEPGPECASSWFGFEGMRDKTRDQRADPSLGPIWLYNVASSWMNLVYFRCATE